MKASIELNQHDVAKNAFNTVCVIGLGYIGLPTAAFIASKEIRVHGVDIDKTRIQLLKNSKVPFNEPGLEQKIRESLSSGRLTVGDSPQPADAFIISVPTPLNDDLNVDISYVRSAAMNVAPHLQSGSLVVLESTVPPGTTKWLGDFLISKRPDLTLTPNKENSLLVAYCPERVLPGRIFDEIEANNRVIGGLDHTASLAAKQLYEAFSNGKIHVTDAATAEMVKLTENSFRDVNIAFANEISVICEDLDIDVWELITIANYHPRVNVLQPGPGVGGHCIAVDPWFIVSVAPEKAPLIRTARQVNDSKSRFVLEKIIRESDDFETPSIAVLGITFKPDVSDLRQSPSLDIVDQLSDSRPNAQIKIVEPNIDKLPSLLENRKNVELTDLDSALADSDIVVILVDHALFNWISVSDLEGKKVIDSKGITPHLKGKLEF